jgi:GT2 family glycosyltransferase
MSGADCSSLDPARNHESIFLLVVCINYCNYEETLEYVSGFLSKLDDKAAARFLIVDNTPLDQRQLTLNQAFSDIDSVQIMTPDSNLGFYPGAAWAFDNYLSDHPFPDWVIVSNTDMALVSKDLVRRLLSYQRTDPGCIIAPSIISSLTGNDQNPQIVNRPSRLAWRRYTVIFRSYALFTLYMFASVVKNFMTSRVKRMFRDADRESGDQSMQIYAPHGSCAIYPREFFESGGTLHHGVMLFGETISVAEQARVLGTKIIYKPDLEFRHREHSTTGRLKSRRIAQLQYLASVYCWENFFRPDEPVLSHLRPHRALNNERK